MARRELMQHAAVKSEAFVLRDAKQGQLTCFAAKPGLYRDARGGIGRFTGETGTVRQKKAAACATALVGLNESVLLQTQIVLDRLYALDAARHFGGFGSGRRRTDEAAQLHGALIGFNVDFSRLQCRFA